MKKILLASLFITNVLSAQITLENSLSSNTAVNVHYTDNSGTFYLSLSNKFDNNQTFKILNSDFSTYKESTINIPNSARLTKSPNFSLSRKIFNDDDKFEIIAFYSTNNLLNGPHNLVIFNEDGTIIKDFGGDFYPYYSSAGVTVYKDDIVKIFVDKKTNRIKMLLRRQNTELYDLGENSLGIQEINDLTQTYAFPVPTSTVLNVTNPKNGSSLIEVFDLSGRKVLTNEISTNIDITQIDVSSLLKGTYVYKIGNSSSKFIKN